jgi:hypothetical protein
MKIFKIIISILLALGFALSLFLLIDFFDLIIFYQKIVSYDNLYYEETPYNKFSIFRITFAFFTLLLGSHYALQYYTSNKRDCPFLVKKKVLNDTLFLPWIVFFVFGKFVALFRVFPHFISRNKHLAVFSELGELIGLLLILVGFFVTTQSLRRYSILSIKNSIFVFLSLIGISFLFSSINLVDRKELEKSALKHNIYFTHNIKPPYSYVSHTVKRKTLVDHYGIAFDSVTNKTVLFTQEGKFGKESIQEIISESRNIRRPERVKSLTSIFHVDSKLSLDSILPFWYEFNMFDANRIGVQTNKEDSIFFFKLNRSIFYDYGKNDLNKKDSVRFTLLPPPPNNLIHLNYLPGCLSRNGRIELKFTEKGILFKDSIIGINELEKMFNQESEFREAVNFSVLVETSQSFKSYIRNKSLVFQMINGVRDKASHKLYKKSFKDLSYEQQRAIRRKYPIGLAEFGLKTLSQKRIESFILEQKELSIFP